MDTKSLGEANTIGFVVCLDGTAGREHSSAERDVDKQDFDSTDPLRGVILEVNIS